MSENLIPKEILFTVCLPLEIICLEMKAGATSARARFNRKSFYFISTFLALTLVRIKKTSHFTKKRGLQSTLLLHC